MTRPAHVPPAVARLVLERAARQLMPGVTPGVRCERCLRPVPNNHQLHHRVAKQMGGSRHTRWIDLPSNIVLLCGTSSSGCHGLCTEVAVGRMLGDGWVVRRGIAEQAGGCAGITAVDTFGAGWLFDDAGTKTRMLLCSCSWSDDPSACPIHGPATNERTSPSWPENR